MVMVEVMGKVMEGRSRVGIRLSRTARYDIEQDLRWRSVFGHDNGSTMKTDLALVADKQLDR